MYNLFKQQYSQKTR